METHQMRKNRASHLCIAFLVTLSFIAVDARAAPLRYRELKKLIPSGGSAEEFFSWSVSISGDTAVVGAVGDGDNGADSGSAFIFASNHGGTTNWGQVKKLVASDGAAGDLFGWSVSISGDTAVVAAVCDDDNGADSGSVFIFERNHGGANNWGQVKKLVASDGAAGDEFGNQVSISGDTALVGANRGDGKVVDSGAAYIFERNRGGPDNWGQVKKLTVIGAVSEDLFGYSVSISGDTALVGVPFDHSIAPTFEKALAQGPTVADSGSAYIFRRNQGGANNWGFVHKLTASDGAAGDHFGWSVSISGDTALVGANRGDGKVADSGSAYIFERNQRGIDKWGPVQELTASDGAARAGFGWSVSISAETAVVGANRDNENGAESGSVYIFGRNQGGTGNWGEVQELTASDGAAGDNFGDSVFISGSTVIVGAKLDDDSGIESGSAYILGRLDKEEPAADSRLEPSADATDMAIPEELSAVLPPSIRLTEISLVSGSMSIKGVSPSAGAVMELIRRMDQSEDFSNVVLEELNRAKVGDETLMAFTLSCQIREAPPRAARQRRWTGVPQ
jgi:hypothetical protein